ncbi:MAG: hypothetical protein A2937_02490 [Candidatus Yonathbacteria bacterium RIFCSPLOWO2_01_FULL_47_33b]|uniref:Ada DNA repair metal-binding domain-containing protein n=1 Tax=Candidatus Yonathbacteria bacterium RIFCSPLOWO2_01_FULL_47_33b TaxID=1802727 RepID=A0A1G2SGY7_9BACT|nr:MAG: hypothetical protein A2937_02490 [Candidatus Yonathbacteria bacterium RIFCSPLOWO2_01_FULL_47_33b]
MSIEDLKEKIKGVGGFSLPQLRTLPDDLFLGLIIVLVAFGSFGLGRLSKIESTKTPIRIENEPQVTVETFTASVAGNKAPTNVDQSASAIGSAVNQLVGSKNGKKYYYPWCSGVSRISEANLLHFASKADAEAQGYTPSSTCKGL